jgi:hypothetical protein
MGGREAEGGPARDYSPWRLTALLLVVAAALVFGLLVANGPPDQEAEATAVLRTRVRAGAVADAVRSEATRIEIAAATGVPVAALRRGLDVTQAAGYRLALRYRADEAGNSATVATEAVRRVGSELLDDALTRADRALVRAEDAGEGVAAAERAAQEARRARDATIDVRVETATVRPSWWTVGMVAVAALLLGAVAACVLAARPGRAAAGLPVARPAPTRPPRPKAKSKARSKAKDKAVSPAGAATAPAAPALSLEELERRLAELTQRTARPARAEEEVSA